MAVTGTSSCVPLPTTVSLPSLNPAADTVYFSGRLTFSWGFTTPATSAVTVTSAGAFTALITRSVAPSLRRVKRAVA